MRPPKVSVPLKDWSNKQLHALIGAKKTPESIKDQARGILKENHEKTFGKDGLLERFFNTDCNLFLRTALWKLHNENKSEIYSIGHKKYFHVSDPVAIFDAMIEIRQKYENQQKENYDE